MIWLKNSGTYTLAVYVKNPRFIFEIFDYNLVTESIKSHKKAHKKDHNHFSKKNGTDNKITNKSKEKA